MSDWRRHRTLTTACVIVACMAATGVAAYASSGGGGAPGATRGDWFPSGTPGPGRQLREAGLNAAAAKSAFTLPDGVAAGTVGNATMRCLVLDVRGHTDARCASPSAIAEGRDIGVRDECGSGGRNLMEITGLAPQGTAGVRLASSDGTSQITPVVSGAFKFDGTNPAKGAPYPTGVEWLDGAGGVTGTASLPVGGDEFCMPAS